MRAQQLIDRVRDEHPHVQVDSWADGDGDQTITFTPSNLDGVSVTVYLRDTDTVQVEAVSFFEDLYTELPSERIETAARIILAFAEHGYIRVRLLGGILRSLFGPGNLPYVQGPAGGYWGVDEYAERFGSEIVEAVAPWLGTRTPNGR